MVTEKQVKDALKKCMDPELGVSIVDLGLVYGIQIKGSTVKVRMTVTTPMCPMASMLVENARDAVSKVKGVKKADVVLVFDPPWTPARMSATAKKALGWSR